MRSVVRTTVFGVLFGASSLYAVGDMAETASLEAQKQALSVITAFADRLCTAIPLSGNTHTLELSGKAKAELSELLKKIANLGIEGSAKYQTAEWQGVLQHDLAAQLNNSRNCKLEVFKDLKERFLYKKREFRMSLYEIAKDRYGMDYKNFLVNDVEECSKTCLIEEKCQSFTFDGRFNNKCWLKYAVPNQGDSHYSVISGVKVEK